MSFILQTSVAFLAGCNADRSSPPELVADKIACRKCNMLLSETRFASAFRNADGNDEIFDDIGCMLLALHNRKDMPEHIWVRDYKSDTWIEAHAAHFISSQKFSTPMNYGFVAVTNAADALELAKADDGKVLTGFDTLIKEFGGRS